MYGYGLVLVDRYALTTAMCEYGCEVKHVLDLKAESLNALVHYARATGKACYC